MPTVIKPHWVGKIIPEPFEWCLVPAGRVTLEPLGVDSDYLKQVTTFDVPTFQIARYPITNAQFEVFAAAQDGWREPTWWDYLDDAKTWHISNPHPAHALFQECADCPRESVAWFAAAAFTRWLSAKTGENITLPTDQQWQRAAQGDDGREYPWGNGWDASRCNSYEAVHGKTTPVVQYPQGASPFGVMDMSGNVWEWCLTDWETGKSDLGGIVEFRIVRGSTWQNGDGDWFRTVDRNWHHADYGGDANGFRVVRGDGS